MNDCNYILEIKDLSYYYEREKALDQISFALTEGAFLAIAGPNGSGKSTLLKLILGLLKIKEGEIKLFNEDLSQFKDWDLIGYVSQKANSFNTGFPATVYEVVASGLTKKIGIFKFMGKKDREKVEAALEAVGLSPFSGKNIGELSGGQQQRVFIARALVSEPKLLILDEPTVGVDADNVRAFYKILQQLNKELGITLILVTHDLAGIFDQVTHIALLNQKLYFFGTKEEFEKLDEREKKKVLAYEPRFVEYERFEGVRK